MIKPRRSGPKPPGPPRQPNLPAVGVAVTGVLAMIVVVGTWPSTGTRSPAAVTSPAAAQPGPMPLAACQQAVAEALNPDRTTCGYDSSSTARPTLGPAADPNDPANAGATLPTRPTTDDQGCTTGPGRPVLDTAFPSLSASIPVVPGLSRVLSTFQIRGVDGPSPQDGDFAGEVASEVAGTTGTAKFDYRMSGPFAQGQTYRWRVRATPPQVPAEGWSAWCEFAIAAKTRDDLGLDAGREYTAALRPAAWQDILTVLGPIETYVSGDESVHAAIRDALKAAPPSARTVEVTMTAPDWFAIVNGLAYHASEKKPGARWELADMVSSALGSHPHPTMGFPRP